MILSQKESRPIQMHTVCEALTRAIETKIGLNQRKKLNFAKKKQHWEHTIIVIDDVHICKLFDNLLFY